MTPEATLWAETQRLPLVECRECGVMCAPRADRAYQCKPCHAAYMREYRARRKAAGGVRLKPIPLIPGKLADGRENPEYKRLHKVSKEYAATWQRNDRRTNAEHRRRNAVRRKVRNAILSGRLVRGPCEACGRTPAQAHHDDYDKPFEVRWLCSTHHGIAHSRGKQ